MERAFLAGIKPPKERIGPAWWWVFRENTLLVQEADTGTTLPHTWTSRSARHSCRSTRNTSARLVAHHCFAVEVAKETEPPAGMRFEGLRALYGPPAGRSLLARRTRDADHRLGPHAPVLRPMRHAHVYHKVDRATQCPNCGLVNYPRIAPAVIVAVERGDELLLARNANFPAAFFSVLAGFVEAGESLEETVRRELREEVSIEVKRSATSAASRGPSRTP